jgi:hypothetical protein
MRAARNRLRPTELRRLSGESKEPFRRASGIAEPYLSRAADRPLITDGLQSGDMRVDCGGGLGAHRPAG